MSFVWMYAVEGVFGVHVEDSDGCTDGTRTDERLSERNRLRTTEAPSVCVSNTVFSVVQG